MADEKQQAAESSSAVDVPSNPKDYAEWRMSGKLPDPPAAAPKSEQSASSKKSSADESAESASAPEAENHQERKPRSNAETRLNEILGDLKKAGLSPAELKTFKRQAQADLAAGGQPQAKPEHTDKPSAIEGPKRPKFEDFTTYEQYEEARDKYLEDLADYKAQKKLDEYRQQQAADAETQALNRKIDGAKKRYGDEAQEIVGSAAVELFQDAKLPAVFRDVLNGSPVIVDLLYVLGSKEGELAGFLDLAHSNPSAALRKLVLMERLVSDELAGKKAPAAGESAEGDSGRDEGGRFKAPDKRVTAAPPPPREASGRAGTPPDEAASAFEHGDFRTFAAAQNRRDIARRRGQ